MPKEYFLLSIPVVLLPSNEFVTRNAKLKKKPCPSISIGRCRFPILPFPYLLPPISVWKRNEEHPKEVADKRENLIRRKNKHAQIPEIEE